MKKIIYVALAALLLTLFTSAVICDMAIYVKLEPRAMVGNVRFFIPFFFGIIIMLFFHWNQDFVYDNLAKAEIVPETIFLTKFSGYVIITQSLTAMIWGHSWWFLILSLIVGATALVLEVMVPFFKEGN